MKISAKLTIVITLSCIANLTFAACDLSVSQQSCTRRADLADSKNRKALHACQECQRRMENTAEGYAKTVSTENCKLLARTLSQKWQLCIGNPNTRW
jgi:hypothetical protein